MYLPTQPPPPGLLKCGDHPPHTPAKAPGGSRSSLPGPGPASQSLSGLGLCFPSRPGLPGMHITHLSSQAQPAGGPCPSPLLTGKLRWERLGLGVSPPPAVVRPWARQRSELWSRGGGKAGEAAWRGLGRRGVSAPQLEALSPPPGALPIPSGRRAPKPPRAPSTGLQLRVLQANRWG